MSVSYSRERKCPCGAAIHNLNKSGKCRPCNLRALNGDPAMKERRVKTVRDKLANDPAFRAKKARVARKNLAIAHADPNWLETVRKQALANQAILHSPENIARKRKAIRDHYDGLLSAWCPADLQPRYKAMVYKGRMPSAEARAILEREIADRNALSSGHLDDALFWLRRIAPVSRLPDGSYRFGLATLSPGEVIERAKLRGWSPERRAA